jgi:phosphopantothenoylcysteine decarboxylase/phosphopantothenate--cysteine ligase
MARILLGVSASIAAYKSLELIRQATAAGHSLRVIQTATSQRFVGAASFAALTGAPVLVDEFERDPARGAFPDQPPPEHEPLSHLALVANADVFLVAPASANTLAKLAHGLADNLLSSAALAARCPLVVAPAMNNHMYESPATQANLELLRARGITVIEPASGRLASRGEWGIGRLAEPAELLSACEALVASAHGGPSATTSLAGTGRTSAQNGGAGSHTGDRVAEPWKDLRVLVTAGGTREPIDSVRFLGNRSSGRMGVALAAAAAARGARVTLLTANVTLPIPAAIDSRPVRTAAELQQACEDAFPDCDVLLMAAAVADFRPAHAADEKISKSGRQGLTLELEATPDILRGLAAVRRADQTVVGFAAEHGAGALARAREKLQAKSLDAVVVNDISRPDIGFEVNDNEVTVVTGAGEQAVALADKDSVAEQILDAVARLRGIADGVR